MRMTPVYDPTIDSLGYELTKQTLYVKLRNGATYEYYGVPPEAYAELMSADCPGDYLDHTIREQYPGRKVSKMIPVNSSGIDSIGYDPQRRILFVKFHNGYTYQYRNVPPHMYAELMNAYSIGAYLNRNVRNRYAYERLWTEKARLTSPLAPLPERA